MKLKLFNIYIDNITMKECINRIDEYIKDGKYHYVVTPNVDHIVRLQQDKEFAEIYNNADLVVTDGMPLVWYSKIKKPAIVEKISGSDLFPEVCKLADRKNYKIFLLGAAEGVAEKAAKRLREKFNNNDLIVGTYSPKFGFDKNEEELKKIIKIINDSKPDILAVGLGVPKQEKFIYQYKHLLKVPICLAIGATIDFEAGEVKRAPKWMQQHGLEWFYRLIKEPRRMFKRYILDDMKIVKLMIKTLFASE